MTAILFRWIFYAFSNFAHRKLPSALSGPQLFSDHFQSGKDIHCPQISVEFCYGGSASSHMRIMDHLMIRSSWHSRAHFQVQFGANVGLNKFLNEFRVLSLTGTTLHWRHNDHDGASNHQPHGSLLNRFFGRWSKKTSKLRVTGLCAGKSPWPVNSPHKGPVTRKMFPFDDVIMKMVNLLLMISHIENHR